MDIIHLLILGLVQGLTEFLPISSSAHLILLPLVAGWEDQGLVYDVAAHAGSLGAVVLYFRNDLRMIAGGSLVLFSSPAAERDYLLVYILLATAPVAVAGLIYHDTVSTTLRNPQVIATSSIVFGLLLLLADKLGERARDLKSIGWRDVVIIGLAQALALVPGTSRSGITITAGLMLGLDRQAASRFSFLLAIPVILLAMLYECCTLSTSGETVLWLPVVIVTIVSFLSAWAAIHFFLALLDRTGLLPYVVYRVVLGLVLLAVY